MNELKKLYSSRQHDDGTIIGELLTEDKEGKEIVKVIKAPSEQGMIFKDPIAFKRKVGVCYVPENDFFVGGYTYDDFLSLAEGNEEIAEYLFETVDWQHPETVLDEDFSIGEIDHCPKCGRLYLSYDKQMCDKCADKEVVINVSSIEWDTDGDLETLNSLPEEVVLKADEVSLNDIRNDSDIVDTVTDFLSNKYGYCIYNCEIVIIKGGGNIPF